MCRVHVRVGQSIVFRDDGRVNHVACPAVLCAVCSGSIRPDEPIRRDGDGLVHSHCWVRRYRTEQRNSVPEPRPDVLAVIRARVAAGSLPRALRTNGKAWAGQGSGRPCDGCDKPVPLSGVECEIALGDRTLRFHRACLVAWQDDLGGPAAQGIGGGSAAAPWTQIFDLRIARRARHERAAREELRIVVAETHAHCVAVRVRSVAARALASSLRRVRA